MLVQKCGVCRGTQNLKPPELLEGEMYNCEGKKLTVSPSTLRCTTRCGGSLMLVHALPDVKARECELAVKKLNKRLDDVSFLVHSKDEAQ